MANILGRLWERLAGRGADPIPHVEDAALGPLAWNHQEESWEGTFGGLRFQLSYNRSAAPSEALLAYARDLLGTPGWLHERLEMAKETAVAEYGPFYAAEIRGLAYEVVYFSEHNGRLRVFATLGPGRDYRCWRIEFAGHTCEGIGFDS